MSLRGLMLTCVWLAALPSPGQPPPATGNTNNAAPTNQAAVVKPPDSHHEQVHAACIAGRRHVCGRVLQISPAGLVVDSGYIALLDPPFNHSWVTRANVVISRPSVQVEGSAPGSVAVGLVILTDIPPHSNVRRFDYVSMIGYPAGRADYVPVEGVKKSLRRFAGGLERAVTLTMQAEKQ